MSAKGHKDGDLTEICLLGDRLHLLQPRCGMRVSTDTLLMAAALSPNRAEAVIEAGSGSGGAALCLATCYPHITVAGVDLDGDMVALARRNAQRNGLEDRVRFYHASVSERIADLPAGSFDHAIANPPFFESATCCVPPDEGKARAFVNRDICLADWVRFCLEMVRHRGTVTFVHRADRLDELLSLLHRKAGEIAIMPVWPRLGVPAKRVVIQARKGMKGAAMMMPGLVLHGPDGAYTREADTVLRTGQGLHLSRRAWERLCHPR